MNTYMQARTILRHQVLNLLGLCARPANGIHILNGHRTQGEPEPETFDRLLDRLAENVKFIRIEEAVQMIMKHEHPDRPLVAFTFDDGFTECYDYFAPLLEKLGVNAMFFVNPNYVEGDDAYIHHFNNDIVLTPGKQPMRWKHLVDLSARGHIIAAHTMDHYMVNTDDEQTLHDQIDTCRRVIEEHLQKPCDYFAFPYGKLEHANLKAIDIACRQYKYVFSQSDYKNYFSFGGRVINRRHFEPFWPYRHVSYFLSCNKSY